MYATTARSDLIEFCPPQPWGYLAVKREYRESGVCPDYGQPLLKPIAAGEGDRVELSAAGIAVNGRAIANTAPRVLDSMKRPLEHYRVRHVCRPARRGLGRVVLELQEL
jgi:type IV secretory pathway protease TraF